MFYPCNIGCVVWVPWARLLQASESTGRGTSKGVVAVAGGGVCTYRSARPCGHIYDYCLSQSVFRVGHSVLYVVRVNYQTFHEWVQVRYHSMDGRKLHVCLRATSMTMAVVLSMVGRDVWYKGSLESSVSRYIECEKAYIPAAKKTLGLRPDMEGKWEAGGSTLWSSDRGERAGVPCVRVQSDFVFNIIWSIKRHHQASLLATENVCYSYDSHHPRIPIEKEIA